MQTLKQDNQLTNLQRAAVIEDTIKLGHGHLTSTGALMIKTGQFTGRAPKDRFIVKDATTEHTVDWNNINMPIDPVSYDKLYKKIIDYANSADRVYVRDAFACANPKYRLNVRVYTEYPWQSLFVYNMFLRVNEKDQKNFTPDWEVYCFPGVTADPSIHNTRQENFAIINFTEKKIIIGGTAYTGEIKKGIFAVLNYLLPTEKNVLSMHCSANMGHKGDTALFFGLSWYR